MANALRSVVNDAETAFRDAEAVFHEVEAERDRALQATIARVTQRVNQEYAARLDVAQKAVDAAREKHEAQIVRDGERRLLVSYGAQRDRLRLEWKWSVQENRIVPTGRRGCLMVCNPDSVFRDNANDFTKPRIGEIYLRVLDRRGNPSQNFEPGEKPVGWKPLDWEPADPTYGRSL